MPLIVLDKVTFAIITSNIQEQPKSFYFFIIKIKINETLLIDSEVILVYFISTNDIIEIHRLLKFNMY